MTNTTNAETLNSPSKTPEWDKMWFDYNYADRTNSSDIEGPNDFGRRMEMQRNALKSENERLKEQLEKWKAVADGLAAYVHSCYIVNEMDPLTESDYYPAYVQLKKESES